MAHCPIGVDRAVAGLLSLGLALTATDRAEEDLQQVLPPRASRPWSSAQPARGRRCAQRALRSFPGCYHATQFKPVWSDPNKVDQLLAWPSPPWSSMVSDPKDYYLDKLKACVPETIR
jgi:hypothetical protein